jgi:hypothetical protein
MLAISKPLSAGQAQSYHQKEFTLQGEQNYGRNAASLPASGRAVSHHAWGSPVRFRLKIVPSSVRASTRTQVNSLFASERRTNTSMRTAR